MSALRWILGSWKSPSAMAVYPTMKDFTYSETLTISEINPMCYSFNSVTNNPATGGVMHCESGFLRQFKDSPKIALIVAQNTGVADVEEGEGNGNEIVVATSSLSRVSFGKEPRVVKLQRVFRRLDDNSMEQVVSMETSKTPMTEHLRAKYTKSD